MNLRKKQLAALGAAGILLTGSGLVYAANGTASLPDTALAGAAVEIAEYEAENKDMGQSITQILEAVNIEQEIFSAEDRMVVSDTVSTSDTEAEVLLAANTTLFTEEELTAYFNSEDRVTVNDSAETEAAVEEESEEDPYSTMLAQFSNLGVVSDVNNYLNVREEPSTDSAVVGKVLKYSGVDILSVTEDGWYEIQSGEVTGYVSAEFVATGADAYNLAYEHARQQLCVTTDCLNVRAEANTEATILTQILMSEHYDVVSIGDGWTEISFGYDDEGNELTGFVSQEYSFLGYYLDEAIPYVEEAVEEEAAVPAVQSYRQQIVNFAMQYLGGAYVWGGTTLGVGVDCSGFMQAVYANFGIYLSRTSASQVNCGTRIGAEQMQPGDLIFYNTSGAGISHVAMYIGNGQIIHAQSPAAGITISAYNIYTPVAIVNVIGQ